MKSRSNILFLMCISLLVEIQGIQTSTSAPQSKEQKTWWQRYKTKIFAGATILLGAGLSVAAISSKMNKDKKESDLMVAIGTIKVDTVEDLLEQGVDIKSINMKYYTGNILDLVVSTFDNAISRSIINYQVLEKKKNDPEIKIKSELLQQLNNIQLITKALIKHGAQPNQPGKPSAPTPIELARQEKNRSLKNYNSQTLKVEWDKLITILEGRIEYID